VLIRVIRGEVLSDLSRLNADRSIEQILPPLVVGSSHQAHDVAAGVEIEGAGLAHKLHSGFIGHLVALAAIAGMAACHQIFPGGSASSRSGHDMIERQFARSQHFAAKLTRVAITQQNILPRERARLVRNTPIFEQSDH
jgi:hypothetical protein